MQCNTRQRPVSISKQKHKHRANASYQGQLTHVSALDESQTTDMCRSVITFWMNLL